MNRVQILEAKIAEVKNKIAEKTRERGEAVADDTNSWHDNSAFDLLNEEILVLRAPSRTQRRSSTNLKPYEIRSHRDFLVGSRAILSMVETSISLKRCRVADSNFFGVPIKSVRKERSVTEGKFFMPI